MSTELPLPVFPAPFGRFQLLDRIAVGGMAEIFKAKMTGAAGFEKIVVIKRILPHLAADKQFVDMFIDEAKLTVHLVHPKIVQVLEFGEVEDQYYIALEYVEGLDCLALLRACAHLRLRMPPPLAVHIGAEVLDALDYAHRALDPEGRVLGIVHRDISPSNVFLSRRGDIKLGDFGIAHATERQSKTQAGTLKGKYGYMSPEQVVGGVLDGRSDIFAVGIVLAEMLMGRRLFTSANDLDVLLMVRDVRLERFHKYGIDIPHPLREIVLRALRRAPGERWQTAGEFRDSLADWLFQHGTRVRPSEVGAFLRTLYVEGTADSDAPQLRQGSGGGASSSPGAPVPGILPAYGTPGSQPRRPSRPPLGASLVPPPPIPSLEPSISTSAATAAPFVSASERRGVEPARPSSGPTELQSLSRAPTALAPSPSGISRPRVPGAAPRAVASRRGSSGLSRRPEDWGIRSRSPAADSARPAAAPGRGGRPASRPGSKPPGEPEPTLELTLDDALQEDTVPDDVPVELDLVGTVKPVTGGRPTASTRAKAGAAGNEAFMLDLDDVADPGPVLDEDGSLDIQLDSGPHPAPPGLATDETTPTSLAEAFQVLESTPVPFEDLLAAGPGVDSDSDAQAQIEAAFARVDHPLAPPGGEYAPTHLVSTRPRSGLPHSAPTEAEPTEPPTEEGDLSQVSATGVFCRLTTARESGMLRFECGGAVKDIYLVQGTPEYVTSNLARELLGEYLVAQGVITSGELSMALAMMPRFGGKLGDALVGLSLLRPLDVFRHLSRQVREKLIDVFTWTRGRYRYWRERANHREAFPLGLDSYEIIGAGVLAIPDEALADHFRALGDRTPRARPGMLVDPDAFQVGLMPRELLSRLDGKRTVAQWSRSVPDERERAALYRTLYLLLEADLATID
jgi:serine/threonine protein kinase